MMERQAMTNQSFYLQMIPKGVRPVIRVSQNDAGQAWLINLLFGKDPFIVPAGAAVYIQGTKPNGSTFKELCSASGSQITAIETQQMTNVCGDVKAEISVHLGDDVLNSINFIIRVEKRA